MCTIVQHYRSPHFCHFGLQTVEPSKLRTANRDGVAVLFTLRGPRSSDGSKIRLNVPEVTTERRKELAKVLRGGLSMRMSLAKFPQEDIQAVLRFARNCHIIVFVRTP